MVIIIFYSKSEKGELVVKDVIKSGDVIITNQISLLEFIYLEMKYSPLFTAVCYKAGKFGLRRIGILELPFYAMGIKFPQEVKESDTNFFTDISVLKASQYCK